MPVGGVAAPRPPVNRFTDHELTRLLKAARHEHYHRIIVLLARIGLRIGEALELRWRDLVREDPLLPPRHPAACRGRRRTRALAPDAAPVGRPAR